MLTPTEKMIFVVVLVGSSVYFIHRARRLYRLIRLGKLDPDNRTHEPLARIGSVMADVLLQRRVLRKPVTGLLHLLIVWGFFVFAVNTINHFAGAFLPGFHLFGNTALSQHYSATSDVFAVLIILGIFGLAVRRYIVRPASLTPKSIESAIVFLFIAGAMMAYLFANATENALETAGHRNSHIVAMALSELFAGMDDTPLRITAHVAWWSDALMHLALIALLVIPTKHLHLVAGPLNLMFKRTRPLGQMTKIDLEREEQFGVSRIDQFTWKQNLDLYACIECGRCADYCAAVTSGKPLSPKKMIVDLKRHLIAHGPAIWASVRCNTPLGPSPQLVGDIVSKEALWSCTTCGNCIEHCPMGIEHTDKITDMRSHLVLMEADFPEEAATTFRNMETAGNPWGLPTSERANWAVGLDVPIMAHKQRTDVLWWVGCSGAYDDRSKKISVAMAKILKAAHVDFAILGEEERCNCESARRLGNEYLYQLATREIIETLRQYQFNRILATCPHCYNTFKNDYAVFENGAFEVIHHTEFIKELIDQKKLPLSSQPVHDVTVVHDSCYLGRYNKLYDAPRDVLEATGYNMSPAAHEKERSFCCGAGGGRMWIEETDGTPINEIRVSELICTGATRIAAACPFCITMLTDGVKKKGATVAVDDVAEIVAGCLES